MYKPIQNALLDENDQFLLVFPKRIRAGEMAIEVFGFKVLRKFPMIYLYNELSELQPYGAEGYYTDFKYLGDEGLGEGNDIFEIFEEYPFRIYHFSIGIKPAFVGYYKAIPSGYTQTAFAFKVPTKPGDLHDLITGKESPYENPTVAGETIIYHKLSFNISLINLGSISVKPFLKVLGAGYDVAPIRDRGLIEDMIKRKVKAKFLTVGGLAEFPFSIPDEWKDYGFSFSRKDFENLLKRW